jgi:hypothetical protein
MRAKPKQNSESQSIAVIDEALALLPDDDSRQRVLSWAVAKYGNAMRLGGTQQTGPAVAAHITTHQPSSDTAEGYGPRARAWIKKHGITSHVIDGAFHIDGDASTLILKTVRGTSKREKLRSVAALLGAMSLVKTDQPKFSNAEFREALKQYEAYDAANGPTNVKAHKDVIQGSASAGYTVTAVGLDLAANLLVSPAADS